MQQWKPITENDFMLLLKEQYAALDDEERAAFDRHKVAPWKARIRRSAVAGEELVYVVAQSNCGVLYFDDVEYGYNISTVDSTGLILTPGGSQNSLKEAVREWFILLSC